MNTAPTIVVLGASGLIGHAVATDLMRRGFTVLPVARRFTPAQRADFRDGFVECPIVALDTAGLLEVFAGRPVDIVVNCLGVLQDGPSGRTDEVHRGFVERLVETLGMRGATLLVHLSVPGRDDDDRTPFSRSKRAAERVIAAAGVPFVILRPGFVIAPAAYGGSALIRALAALPIGLAADVADRPFAAVDVADIASTIAIVAQRWRGGDQRWSAIWDVMERSTTTVGGVVEALRRRFGGPNVLVRLPGWLLDFGAVAGDLVGRLGWTPPIRSTALAEMRRGVVGDPAPWIAATGIEPASLDEALERLHATVQERWFARLYLAKAVIIVALALFWIASGLVALTVAFDAAIAMMIAHGFSPRPAQAFTALTSLMDIGIGLAIAARRTCRAGLLAGIVVSLGYMAGTALFTPDLWLEPLGALIKTGPAIILMLVALAIFDDR